MEMHPLYMAIDPYLIWFYRITGYSFVDFLIGTFVLAFFALLLGELTISMVFLLNRKYIDENTEEMVRYQNMSVDAIAAGDKQSYSAANKMANDAFGKSFFMQIALSAGFLWPIFFALAWMEHRFSDVEFRLVLSEHTVGYMCVFIVLYVAAYLLFKRVKYRLPYFRRVKSVLDSYSASAAKMKTFDDLCGPKEEKSPMR